MATAGRSCDRTSAVAAEPSHAPMSCPSGALSYCRQATHAHDAAAPPAWHAARRHAGRLGRRRPLPAAAAPPAAHGSRGRGGSCIRWGRGRGLGAQQQQRRADHQRSGERVAPQPGHWQPSNGVGWLRHLDAPRHRGRGRQHQLLGHRLHGRGAGPAAGRLRQAVPDWLLDGAGPWHSAAAPTAPPLLPTCHVIATRTPWPGFQQAANKLPTRQIPAGNQRIYRCDLCGVVTPSRRHYDYHLQVRRF